MWQLSLPVDPAPTEKPMSAVATPVSPLAARLDEQRESSVDKEQNLNNDHLRNLLSDSISSTPTDAVDSHETEAISPAEPRIRTVQTLEHPDRTTAAHSWDSSQEPSAPTSPSATLEALAVATAEGSVVNPAADSRRVLPPKSAQRSRSISHNSSRLSQSSHNDHSDRAPGSSSGSSAPSTPQEAMTPAFGASGARKFLRPFPSSPSLSSNGSQLAPASPRLPTRSNSRRQPQAIVNPSTPSSNENGQQQSAPFGAQAPPPVIPPRSRSGSSSLSRSNTMTRPDGSQDSYMHPCPTPTIAEDSETMSGVEPSSSPQQPQPATLLDESEAKASSSSNSANTPHTPGHARKKSSSNGLRRLNEEDESGHALAPSLLPAEPLPSHSHASHSQSHVQNQNQHQQNESDSTAFRPALRKQKSADPGSMYRQQDESSLAPGRLPSRHASERRPNRDRNHSSPGTAGFGDRSTSQPSPHPAQQERGRSQSKDDGSKGGLFSWVRSRSKSKDASLARPSYDTSHPVPEQPSYPEYNPALIPSRNASNVGNALRRDKSVPRKASNQNFHATENGAWPPYSPNGKGGEMEPPVQRKKSLSRPGPNGTIIAPTLHRMAPSTALDGSTPQSSLNISTNTSTTYHDNMIRGMGMGSTPITPTVLLTPQPSFPSTSAPAQAGNLRGMALNMMKEEDAKNHAHEQQQMQQQLQRQQQQLQQAQMQHLQQQQQKLAASVANSMTSPPGTPTRTTAPQGPLSPAAPAAASVRLVATRIYVQTETDFKSVNLAPNSTALDALHMLQQRGCFGEPGDGRYHDRWTIFEYSKDFLIERPLRDFEVVLDVMKTWEADKDNKMICKSFPARDELAAKEIIRLVGPAGQASFVRPHGWVHLETKKSKWVKRYLHATDTAVYHSKDEKFNGESMLCLLRNFDVYAVQVPRKKAPTKFGFALKSSDKIHLFETPEDDYIHYVCTDSGDSLREWLVGLRASKGIHMYHANPEIIREGQKHAQELMSAGAEGGMSRSNLTEEQVRTAEAKLAGWGMGLNGGGSSGSR
ncbi:hypothetical protein BG004_003433 [Podila humilis]|nr:hypothetical protein BG004_003433 [Podila humilis]